LPRRRYAATPEKTIRGARLEGFDRYGDPVRRTRLNVLFWLTILFRHTVRFPRFLLSACALLLADQIVVEDKFVAVRDK
jgi:hypothetical protein